VRQRAAARIRGTQTDRPSRLSGQAGGGGGGGRGGGGGEGGAGEGGGVEARAECGKGEDLKDKGCKFPGITARHHFSTVLYTLNFS